MLVHKQLVLFCVRFLICASNKVVLPDELKIDSVTPIYKSGSKDEFSDYRPVFVILIFAKILKKIVHKKTV